MLRNHAEALNEGVQ